MSTDRIARLHEQASEHYLSGEYQAALQSWREVLALEPSNEQALDGVRMAAQFAEPASSSLHAPSAEVERDLDQGLKVFDSLGGAARSADPVDPNATMMLDRGAIDTMTDRPPRPASAKPAPDATRQTEGIDFGDLTEVEALPLDTLDQAAAWQPPQEAEPIFGLAPAPHAAAAAPASPSAAAVELKRRVDDLLAQAKAKADAGEIDEARSILVRVTILDEDNAEAEAMRLRLEQEGRSDLDAIEQAIIEGVAALESDRLDDAERWFGQALALQPDHREALHYLEQVKSRRAGPSASGLPPGFGGEELLGGGGAVGDLPERPASPGSIPIAPNAREAVKPSRALPTAPESPEPQHRNRLVLPSPRALFFAGMIAIAGVGAVIAVPQLLGSRSHPVPAPAPPARPVRPPTPPAATPASTSKTPAEAAANAKAAAANVEKGRRLMASGDLSGAVIAFNDAIQLEPQNLDARASLTEAAGLYKARKSEVDALDGIKMAFRDGEYASGLRLSYRLPPTVDALRIERIKVAGWYNLAIVALRSGDCRSGITNLDEALGIAPDDPDAKKLREFASRYLDAPKNRGFLDAVESLPFRSFPE